MLKTSPWHCLPLHHPGGYRGEKLLHALQVSGLSAIQIQWFIRMFKWKENRASLTQHVISTLTHWHVVRNILSVCYCSQYESLVTTHSYRWKTVYKNGVILHLRTGMTGHITAIAKHISPDLLPRVSSFNSCAFTFFPSSTSHWRLLWRRLTCESVAAWQMSQRGMIEFRCFMEIMLTLQTCVISPGRQRDGHEHLSVRAGGLTPREKWTELWKSRPRM